MASEQFTQPLSPHHSWRFIANARRRDARRALRDVQPFAAMYPWLQQKLHESCGL